MRMEKDDGACSRRQGGRAGARFSRPPEQPLAPEVAPASSGHLGHQVTNNGGLECLELTITRHTKQAGMGIWGSVAGQAGSLSLESMTPLPKGKKKIWRLQTPQHKEPLRED